MENEWKYQVRFTASDALAALLREQAVSLAHARLAALLSEHQATIQCQYDAFAGYVAEAQSHGTEHYALYDWTLATIENPDKKRKYLRAFTVYVNGAEIYDKAIADALDAGLSALTEDGAISDVKCFDSNPAHNPQPPARSTTE